MQTTKNAKLHLMVVRCPHLNNKFHKTEYWLNVETENQTYQLEIDYKDAMYIASTETGMYLQHLTKQQLLDSKGVII